MVIARGFKLGTLYKLDACTIECNSTSVKSKCVTTSLGKERVSFSMDGHGLWVPKGALSSESKFPIEKTIL